jgi:hypothetical protein
LTLSSSPDAGNSIYSTKASMAGHSVCRKERKLVMFASAVSWCG